MLACNIISVRNLDKCFTKTWGNFVAEYCFYILSSCCHRNFPQSVCSSSDTTLLFFAWFNFVSRFVCIWKMYVVLNSYHVAMMNCWKKICHWQVSWKNKHGGLTGSTNLWKSFRRLMCYWKLSLTYVWECQAKLVFHPYQNSILHRAVSLSCR